MAVLEPPGDGRRDTSSRATGH